MAVNPAIHCIGLGSGWFLGVFILSALVFIRMHKAKMITADSLRSVLTVVFSAMIAMWLMWYELDIAIIYFFNPYAMVGCAAGCSSGTHCYNPYGQNIDAMLSTFATTCCRFVVLSCLRYRNIIGSQQSRIAAHQSFS